MNREKKEVSAKERSVRIDYARNNCKHPEGVNVKKGSKTTSVSRQIIRQIFSVRFNKKINVVFKITDFY